MATTNIGYVDGFVLVVPKKNLKAYRKMAQEGKQLWMKLGAVDYKECVGDDMGASNGGWAGVRFPKLAKAKAGEVVVFSYVGYKNRAHRDAVNKKLLVKMKEFARDPKRKHQKMPFDEKKMAYGGFKVLVG